MPLSPRRFLKYWLPALLWMGLIFFLSTDAGSGAHTSIILEPLLRWLNPSITRQGLEEAHHIIRKIGHLSEYAVLGVLLWRLLRHRAGAFSSPAWKSAGVALLLAAAYASTDEFHQSFIPSRGPSVQDVLIDTGGALAGLVVVLVWRVRRKLKAAQDTT